MQKIDYLVVGAGVVGLAIGAALAPFGSTAVLERRARPVEETSARNSGVVHGGLYYPSDSLKLKLCLRGNESIWRMQERFPSAIAAKRIGKWIGTCDASEEPALQKLIDNMKARGIAYEMISKERMQKEEPLLAMETVVNSVNTGIVDIHSLRDFFVSTMEAQEDGFLSCCQEATRIDFSTEGTPSLTVTIRDTSRGDGEEDKLEVSKAVICAPGLHANTLWSRLYHNGQEKPMTQPANHRLYFCKGRYATYMGKPLVSRLVYPCPMPKLVGLGVHSVVDMDGRVKFGPDTLYVTDPTNYLVAESEAEEAAFLDSQWKAIRRYIPSIERSRLAPDFAGIRPKLSAAGEPARDFLIDEITSVAADGEPLVKGLTGKWEGAMEGPRLVMLNGIESPGLTSSPAIGEFVAQSLLPPDVYEQHKPSWV